MHNDEREITEFGKTEATPWKRAMKRILVGIALNTITLHFLCLNDILSTVGVILQLLGFRTLRKENTWFHACFLLSAIHTGFVFLSLICNTTILPSMLTDSPVALAVVAGGVALVFFKYVCLWCGLVNVQEKAGLPTHAGSAVALLVWYTLMCLLAMLQYSGWLIVGVMTVGYIAILHNIYQLVKEIDDAGYAAQTVSVRITDCRIVVSFLLFLLVGFACGYTFGGSYPRALKNLRF